MLTTWMRSILKEYKELGIGVEMNLAWVGMTIFGVYATIKLAQLFGGM